MRFPPRLCLSLLTVAALAGFGCEKKKLGYRRHAFTTRNMKSSVDDVRLPVGLWAKIETVFRGESAQAPRSSSTANEQVPTAFMPVKVYLIEKNRGILGGANHELLLHEGGGEIDLKDFLADRSGTFYFAVETVVEGNDLPPKVFYLSNAKRRQLGGQTLGAGCETYHEITSFFARSMQGDGIMTNTTAGRHVSALAGTYFFAVSHAGKLNLARLTIKDSRFRPLHCRRGN